MNAIHEESRSTSAGVAGGLCAPARHGAARSVILVWTALGIAACAGNAALGENGSGASATGIDAAAGDGGAGSSPPGDGMSGSDAHGADPSDGSAPNQSLDAGPTSDGGPTLTESDYVTLIKRDYQGENGVPSGGDASVGYPAGVPNSYSWKFATTGVADIPGAIAGRGPQRAGAAYDQVYQHRPGDAPATNARVLLEPIRAYVFSTAHQAWSILEDTPVAGAAFAEDFLNNESTGADSRDEGNGRISVRSGSNAAGAAGGTSGRSVEDGLVGYNFHGFDKRFDVDWSDVEAILITQVMSCVPDTGNDLSDCLRVPYIANVGVDSWATTTSAYDGFKTHGGVSGGRFKPVTVARQIFTNYVGPLSLLGANPPPVPSGI